MIITAANIDILDFARGGTGLVTVVAQHATTGEVLMVAHADREAVDRTLASGDLTLYSRSRRALWRKGETSDNTMRVVALHADCDRDAILALVLPAGPACHTGARTCFDGGLPTLPLLAETIAARANAAADTSYTRRLLDNPNLRLKKLGEEAVELALACTSGNSAVDPAAVAEEGADLMYHTLVACHAAGVTLQEIAGVLERRSERTPPAEDQTINRK
jgi:phosphoribosyl-ATP pyrophosphohydrolase/phosphoribosyl-AMP cyclohydrolase